MKLKPHINIASRNRVKDLLGPLSRKRVMSEENKTDRANRRLFARAQIHHGR